MPGRLHQRVHPIHTELWVEVRALTSPIDEHFGVVKALRRRAQMPLADHSGFVPVLLEHFRESEQVPIEITPIHILVEAIHVAELTGQNRRSARSANAVGAIHLVHSCPVLGNPVDVGGRSKF